MEGERCGVNNWRGYRVSSVEGTCLWWWLFVVHGVDEIKCKTQSWKLTSSFIKFYYRLKNLQSISHALTFQKTQS